MNRRLKMQREADAKVIQADKRHRKGHDEHAADRSVARKPDSALADPSEPGPFPERGGGAPRAGERIAVDHLGDGRFDVRSERTLSVSEPTREARAARSAGGHPNRCSLRASWLPWLAWRPIRLSHSPQALAKLLQGDDDFVDTP